MTAARTSASKATAASARDSRADAAATFTKGADPSRARRYNRSFPARDLRVNPRLSLLQPYPFERLRALFAGVTPNPAKRAISLSIGEPRHPTPSSCSTRCAPAVRDWPIIP